MALAAGVLRYYNPSMALPKEEKYSWEDYLSWDEDDRYELVNGVVFAMSPAPNTGHQRISSLLHTEIGTFLKGKTCDVFSAPTDLKLSSFFEDGAPTVLQPDLMVVCDKNKIGKQAVEGAPDLVIEILSVYTAKRDEVVKKELYEKAGVGEYWIIHPSEEYIVRYSLKDRVYQEPVYKIDPLK